MSDLEESLSDLNRSISNLREKISADAQALACAPQTKTSVAASGTQTTDAIVAAGIARSRELLESISSGVSLVEVDGVLHVSLEPWSSAWATLTETEYLAISDAYDRFNTAAAKGFVEIKAGVNSVRLVDFAAALEALAPGVFDPVRLEAALALPPDSADKTVGGCRWQWFPLGFVVTFTPAGTQRLLAALGVAGGIAGVIKAILALLAQVGIAGPLAGAIAAAIALLAAQIKLCAKLSKKGAVGLKIILLNPPLPPMVVPFPA
jgi:hypothetical protein